MRDVLFQMLEYQRLVSRFSVGKDTDLIEKKEKIARAHDKLVKSVKGSEELEISL